MNNYKKKILDSHSAGELNEYTAKKLMNACSSGMTDDLVEQALDDAKHSTKHGIENDEDYNLRFFVANVVDDMMEDTFKSKLDDSDKCELLLYVLKNKGELKDLTGLRVVIYKWLCGREGGRKKKAYPNTAGKENRDPQYDRNKWAQSVNTVYKMISSSDDVTRESAIGLVTAKWSDDESFKFKNWLRYYESGNAEKYNVKNAHTKQALPADVADLGLPQNMLNPDTRSNQQMSSYRVRKDKTQKERAMSSARDIKMKMQSRIRSLRRLLDKYNQLLPHQNVEQIQDEIYALDKSLMRVDVRATAVDCIVRTAERIRELGFSEGADFLTKVAAGEDVLESIPDPVSSEPNLPQQGEQLIDVQTIIARLEGIGKELKSRNMIRELASIDILLNEIGLSSYFPELSLAQSKLIEAFGYSSSKVEDIVAKLRGSGQAPSAPVSTPVQPKPPSQLEMPPMPSQPQPLPSPDLTPPISPREEKIEVDELRSKPIGEVKRKLPTR